MNFINLALLIALIKLHGDIKPKSLALIYTAFVFLIGIIFGPFLSVLLGSVITFFIAWLYFGLLEKITNSFAWWIVMLLGAFIFFI